MKKLKWLFGVCLIVLVVCGGGMCVQAADGGTDSEVDVSDFIWIRNLDGTIYINDYNGTDETIIIPSEIEGKTVSSIGDGAFSNNNVLKHVIIPKGITIGQKSFKNCKKLETVQLSEGIKSIPLEAFSGCSNLVNINFPNTLKNIAFCAFQDCTKFEKMKFPSNLTDIHSNAFVGCSNLIEIEFEEGTMSVNFFTFNPCHNLKKMIVPDSVKEISSFGISAFSDSFAIYASPNSYARTYANQMGIKFSCLNTHDWDKGVVTTQPTASNDGIKIFTCTACKTKRTEKITKLGLPQNGKTVTESKSNNAYKVTKSGAKDGTVELEKVGKFTSSITVPDTVTVDGVTYKVTSMSKKVFKNNKKLKKVTLGKNITKINSNTFYGCKNLNTITIKSTNLKSVGKNAFKGINSKAKIKVPKNKLAKYKKILKGKGQKSTVKIVK